MDNRKRMGKNRDGVIFPVAPNLSEISDTYLKFIEEIKAEIQKQRIAVVLNANSSMICLYWNIGKAIIKKQEKDGWGAKVIDRMAKDLKDAFPDMSGFLREISNICGNLPNAGLILNLCNRLWHKFRGEQIECCWINWIRKKAVSGMRIKQ